MIHSTIRNLQNALDELKAAVALGQEIDQDTLEIAAMIHEFSDGLVEEIEDQINNR